MKAPYISVGGPSSGIMTDIYLHACDKQIRLTPDQCASLVREAAWAMSQVINGAQHVARVKVGEVFK